MTYAIVDLEGFNQYMALTDPTEKCFKFMISAKDFGSDQDEESAVRWYGHNTAITMRDTIDKYLMMRRMKNERNVGTYGGVFIDRKCFKPIETMLIHKSRGLDLSTKNVKLGENIDRFITGYEILLSLQMLLWHRLWT